MPKRILGRKKCHACRKWYHRPSGMSTPYWERRKTCSNECRGRYMETWKKERTNAWKGDLAGIISKHKWLHSNYGKASKCENSNGKILGEKCKGGAKRYEWARKKNYPHAHNASNYYQLCAKCHRKYDMTEEIKLKISKALMGHIPWNKGLKGRQVAWNKGLHCEYKDGKFIYDRHKNIKN